ncbi:hypothetical protein CDO73_26365 [Saccharibacillus sp. O23]|nr:hypothetical protein CDO73_26365 [Saccharibacillus sp. O23]
MGHLSPARVQARLGPLMVRVASRLRARTEKKNRESLSPPVFLHISTHFTATHGIPLSPLALKLNSFQSVLWLSHSL